MISASPRHCEHSEAIQRLHQQRLWQTSESPQHFVPREDNHSHHEVVQPARQTISASLQKSLQLRAKRGRKRGNPARGHCKKAFSCEQSAAESAAIQHGVIASEARQSSALINNAFGKKLDRHGLTASRRHRPLSLRGKRGNPVPLSTMPLAIQQDERENR